MRHFLLTTLISTIFVISAMCEDTYTLYIASTKDNLVAQSYIEKANDLLQTENLIVRTHKKKDYSLIINQIKTIDEAKRLQTKVERLTSFKDTYIKKDTNNLKYTILYYTKNINNEIKIQEDEKEFVLDVESSNEYITASTMYNIGNYKRSYELFNNLFFKHNYNVNINYFLAQSALKIGKLDEASIALERVLIENPKFNKARYDYARLLTKLNLKEEAKKEFNILQKENINDETKKDVEKYLKFLNKKKKYTSNTATLILGVGHNTNVNNGPLSTDFRLPGLENILVSGEKPINDNFHNEVLSLSFNRVLKSNPSIRITNNFLAYNKSYSKEKDENTSVISYRPSISYMHNQNIYGLDLNATRVIKKENEDINVFSISPSITNKTIKTFLEYQKLLYVNDENKEKDFDKYSFNFIYNLLNNLKIYTEVSKVIRIKKERIDIDKVTKAIGLNYNYELNNKNMLYLSYKLSKNNFRYFNQFFDNTRKDTTHDLSLSYLYSISNQDKVNFVSSYTRNNSNQDASAYKRTEATLNYIKKFNW